MKRAIIFDMDGTLWDSSEQVTEAWNQVFAERDIHKQITVDDMHGFMGKVMEDIIRSILPDYDEAFQMQMLKECCENEQQYLKQHGATLYEGLKDTIETLKQQYALYIVSNSQDGYIQLFLKHYGFESYFEDIEMAGRTGKRKGENIRLVMERNHAEEGIYIGDTILDYEAAMEAGVGFIWASYGFGNVEHPCKKITSFREIPKAVKEVFGL